MRPRTKIVSTLPFSIGNVILPVVPTVTATTVMRSSLSDLRDISTEALVRTDEHFGPHFYYGGVGTPTIDHLANVIAGWEGGKAAVLVPSGQATIAAAMTTLARPGSTVLVPDNVTSSTRWYFDRILGATGIGVEYYDACSTADVRARMSAATSVLFVESPGAVTFEVVDLPALAAAAREHGAAVVADNSWAASHYFDAIAAGAHAVVVSLTKYQAAPAGVALGAVITADPALDLRVRDTAALLGLYVAPESCVKAAVAMSTLSVRLEAQERTTARVLAWLSAHPAVRAVHHPSLPGAPGHEIWRRDFTGANSVCSIQLADGRPEAAYAAASAMRLFRPGYGWGGSNSLCSVIRPYADRTIMKGEPDAAYIRLYLGLEDPEDLVDDLEQALAAAPAV